MILPASFYAQNACVVARELLGARLVHMINGQRVSGRIVETEAYSGITDLASHGRAGRTPRNLPMWGEPGRAYIYLTYGMHWLLNVVCEPVETPAAVLIRAIEPLEGLDVMAVNRVGLTRRQWTSGPARLTTAMGIDQRFNLADMTTESTGIWLEVDTPLMDADVLSGPRVGLGKRVGEPWYSMPWRWWHASSLYVSRWKP